MFAVYTTDNVQKRLQELKEQNAMYETFCVSIIVESSISANRIDGRPLECRQLDARARSSENAAVFRFYGPLLAPLWEPLVYPNGDAIAMNPLGGYETLPVKSTGAYAASTEA